MKLKNMKKVLAAVLSTTMVMGMSMTALASDGKVTSTSPTNPMGSGGSISAPIFSLDVINVVVPTSYGVAFNPDQLDITVSTATTPTTVTSSTVASKNFGIINKSSKDKIVRVGLNVTSTTASPKVTFVNTPASATNAQKGEYKICLQAVAADTTPIKIMTKTSAGQITATTPTTATEPAKLAHVQMTPAGTSGTVPMKAGDNEIAFKLSKATYALKSNNSLDLENLGSASNDVKDKYEPTGLNLNSGVTGFTFTGAMNSNADWTKVTGKVLITPTYTVETADSTVTPITGGGAMIKAGPQVSVSATGLITVSGMTSDKLFASMEISNKNGGPHDITVADVDWGMDNYNSSTGGSFTCQLGDVWMSTLAGYSAGKVKVTFTDGTFVETATNIPSA